jgi:hypothetical protein
MTPEDGARLRRERFWKTLDDFAVSLEPRLARAYAAVLAGLRAAFTLAQWDDIVQRGDVTPITEALNAQPLQMALRESVAASAGETAILGQLKVEFDILHPYVSDALRIFESRAIQTLEQEVRSGVLAYLNTTVSRGINPREIARGLRDQIGLPPNLVQAGARYREMLTSGDAGQLKQALTRAIRDKRFDGTIERAISGQTSLTREQIDRQMERWYERALTVHTETIARTASMDAVNVGNRLAWQQVVADGQVSIHNLRRYWVVAKDEKVCPDCKPVPMMNPDGRAWDELFATPVGDVLIPTLHFRCRCVIWTAVEET